MQDHPLRENQALVWYQWVSTLAGIAERQTKFVSGQTVRSVLRLFYCCLQIRPPFPSHFDKLSDRKKGDEFVSQCTTLTLACRNSGFIQAFPVPDFWCPGSTWTSAFPALPDSPGRAGKRGIQAEPGYQDFDRLPSPSSPRARGQNAAGN
jgi:hypothetical protein